jgi:hypothetical protein
VCVDRDHLITGSHVDDPRIVSVSPIRKPATGHLAGRRAAALAFVDPMHPEQFSGCGIQRDDVAA